MAAPSVHNVTGRKCKVCGYEFTASSMSLCIRRKGPEAGIISRDRVCIACYESHYSKGE